MTIWALSLAARALRNGEARVLPVRLLFFDLVLFGIYGVYLWFPLWNGRLTNLDDWRYEWFLPVLFPFGALLAFSILISVRVGHFVLDKWSARAGQMAPSESERRRFVNRVAALIAVILVFTILPFLLFVFSFIRQRSDLQRASLLILRTFTAI